MQEILEWAPVVLAFPTMILCFKRIPDSRRELDRIFYFLAGFACLSLVFAQTSWAMTVMAALTSETTAAGWTWRIFDTIAMAAYVIFGRHYQRRGG